MHTYTPPDSIFDGPVTNLLSILCILIEILSRAHPKGGRQTLIVLNLALLVVVFLSDGAAGMAFKGLIVRDKVYKTVSTNHNLFEGKGEPKRIQTEALLLTTLTPLPLGQTGSQAR